MSIILLGEHVLTPFLPLSTPIRGGKRKKRLLKVTHMDSLPQRDPWTHPLYPPLYSVKRGEEENLPGSSYPLFAPQRGGRG
jgi:hypothetical protein